ncbi:MAG: RDD family protein [archaeon]
MAKRSSKQKSKTKVSKSNPIPKNYPKASIWKRALAALLDAVFTALLALLLIIPGVVYYFIKDGLEGGQSWGNRIMGLKVVNLETGKPCTKYQSILRSLFMAVEPVNLIEMLMVLFEQKGQRLADMILHTNVLEVKK